METDDASSLSDDPVLRCASSPGQPASMSSCGRGLVSDDLDVGIGREAEGDMFRLSAACLCTSSLPVEPLGVRAGDADCSRSCRQLSERTTSPLQMGHVLRRVTSQGVLGMSDSIPQRIGVGHLHAIRVELVATR